MHHFAIGDSLRFGWETFKKKPLQLIGAFIIVFIVSAMFSAFDRNGQGATSALLSIVGLVVGTFAEMGLITFILATHDRAEGATLAQLWNPKPFWYYLAAKILMGIITVVGFILLIVPGIIVAIGLMFTTFLIIDQNLGPIEAMKESWRMTTGHKWQLFLLVLSIILLNIVGLLVVGVGLLVTVPVSYLAVAHVYRKLALSPHEMSNVSVA